MQKMKVVGQTVQPWERKQTDRRTDGQTDGRYQVHYLPRFAVDKYCEIVIRSLQFML